ncbi:MAG: glycosyltransferase family 2 protein [bacterium]|nr:glycosyltransferase family 2 protein [bacterium]
MVNPSGVPDVLVVIPNLNGASVLDATLGALGAAAPNLTLRVVVVDNASTDGSVERVRTAFPDVEVLVNSENVGFARACNQGGRSASSRHVLLLNSDVTLLPGSLEAMVAHLDRESGLGAVTPLMHWPDGRVQGPRLAARQRRIGRPVPMSWLPGTCLLLRRAALEAVDWLDEDFFFFNEDLDLSWRLRRSGWRLACLPAVHVRHHEGVATRSDPAVLTRAVREGFLGTVMLARKHHPWATGLVRRVVRLDVLFRAARIRARSRRGLLPSRHEQALLDGLPELIAGLERV